MKKHTIICSSACCLLTVQFKWARRVEHCVIYFGIKKKFSLILPVHHRWSYGCLFCEWLVVQVSVHNLYLWSSSFKQQKAKTFSKSFLFTGNSEFPFFHHTLCSLRSYVVFQSIWVLIESLSKSLSYVSGVPWALYSCTYSFKQI